MANPKKLHHDTPLAVASGVEELIARLRDQGVEKGRAEAEALVQEARSTAAATLAQAEAQARSIVERARAEAESLQTSGRQALELAFRDATLALKAQLSERFTGEVRQLVGEEQEKQEILERMILEIVGALRPEADQSRQVEVLLPRRIAGLAELSQHPEELEQGILSRFVRLTARGLLREGVSFGVAKGPEAGLKLRLVDRDVVLDLTDAAIAQTLLAHLQPRFRALLEGVVK
jgi:V/A-type H+-transporting ATPase subunit E